MYMCVYIYIMIYIYIYIHTHDFGHTYQNRVRDLWGPPTNHWPGSYSSIVL